MKDNVNSAIPLALLVCDTVITDAMTGKKTLVGIFNALGATKFPHIIPNMNIFASLTNLEGEVEVKIKMIAGNDDVVFELPAKVPFKNPFETPELFFNLQNFRVNAPGSYELQLIAKDEVIASRLLIFKEVRPPAKDQQNKPQ